MLKAIRTYAAMGVLASASLFTAQPALAERPYAEQFADSQCRQGRWEEWWPGQFANYNECAAHFWDEYCVGAPINDDPLGDHDGCAKGNPFD